MVTGAIPILNVGIANGKGFVMTFPFTIELKVTGTGITRLEEL